LPDASVLVLQGFAFLLILASEALRGRLFSAAVRVVPVEVPQEPHHTPVRTELVEGPVHPEPVEGPELVEGSDRPELVEVPVADRGFDKLSPNGVDPILSGDPA